MNIGSSTTTVCLRAAKGEVMSKIEVVEMWAWEIQGLRAGKWVLCHWARGSKDGLLEETKPTPEARPVRVRVMRNRDYLAKQRKEKP